MVARQRLDQPGAITGIARRLRSSESRASLGFSSITRGGMRVASADGLLVQTVAGGLPGLRVTGLEVVDGTLRVTGTLEGSGTFTWTGTLNQLGATNLRGPVAITGETGTLTVDATTLLRGITTLLTDLIVNAPGKITVGGMIIDPADGGGSVAFPGGAKLQADPSGGVRMIQGTNRVYVGAGLVTMQMGSRSFSISASGFQMSGADTIPSSLAGGAAPGTIWTDGTEVFRVVAG